MTNTAKPHRSLQELYTRRAICKVVISYLYREARGDPRCSDAIAEYQNQLASIDAQITELTGKPPDITVGLKTAVLNLSVKQGE